MKGGHLRIQVEHSECSWGAGHLSGYPHLGQRFALAGWPPNLLSSRSTNQGAKIRPIKTYESTGSIRSIGITSLGHVPADSPIIRQGSIRPVIVSYPTTKDLAQFIPHPCDSRRSSPGFAASIGPRSPGTPAIRPDSSALWDPPPY